MIFDRLGSIDGKKFDQSIRIDLAENDRSTNHDIVIVRFVRFWRVKIKEKSPLFIFHFNQFICNLDKFKFLLHFR